MRTMRAMHCGRSRSSSRRRRRRSAYTCVRVRKRRTGRGEEGGGGEAMLTAISECEVDPVTGFIGCRETKIRTLCYWGIFFLPPPKAGDFNSPRESETSSTFFEKREERE